MAPLQAVYKHVPKLPPQGPEDPGPFAFASEARVNRVLGAAGFAGIAMEPCNLALDVAIGRGLEAAVQGAFEIGPASRALEGHPPEVRAAATNTVRFGSRRWRSLRCKIQWRHGPAALLLSASIWIVTARRRRSRSAGPKSRGLCCTPGTVTSAGLIDPVTRL